MEIPAINIEAAPEPRPSSVTAAEQEPKQQPAPIPGMGALALSNVMLPGLKKVLDEVAAGTGNNRTRFQSS